MIKSSKILTIRPTLKYTTEVISTFSNKMSKTAIRDLLQIFQSSYSAVLPEKLIRNNIKYNKNSEQLTIAGETYNLSKRDLYLVGTGKAVQNMAKEVEEILGSKIKQGIISIPLGSSTQDSSKKNVRYYEGAKNNLPDIYSQATAIRVDKLVRKLSSNDILLVLISGGGSALLPLPKIPMNLDEKAQIVKELANAGADITELNTVRKRLSDLKGGQLAIKAQPAYVVSLILSDIVGDPLDFIASGPTVENQDDPTDALKIIEKFNLYTELNISIKSVLLPIDKEEFPTSKVKNHIIGSNKISISAAKDEAENLNYVPIALSNIVTGNVSEIAKEYVKLTENLGNFITGKYNKHILKEKMNSLNIPGVSDKSLHDDEILLAVENRDVCLILGGEITVKVRGNGKGGRNQQLALEFSKFAHTLKEKFNNFEVYFLSAGTDGIDGPTDAAGAIGHLDLIPEARQANIDVDEYLLNNDSYNFYKQFQNGNLHVITGHTNTNVMDIHLIMIKRKL